MRRDNKRVRAQYASNTIAPAPETSEIPTSGGGLNSFSYTSMYSLPNRMTSMCASAPLVRSFIILTSILALVVAIGCANNQQPAHTRACGRKNGRGGREDCRYSNPTAPYGNAYPNTHAPTYGYALCLRTAFATSDGSERAGSILCHAYAPSTYAHTQNGHRSYAYPGLHIGGATILPRCGG